MRTLKVIVSSQRLEEEEKFHNTGEQQVYMENRIKYFSANNIREEEGSERVE